MSKVVTSVFRDSFKLSHSKSIKWFPGHMQGALFQIQAKLKKIDCIVEVHDARIPFSGRNSRIRDIIKLRPHVLLLNKTDLTDFSSNEDRRQQVEKKLKEEGTDKVLFTSLKNINNDSYLRKDILPLAKDLVSSRPRYQREGAEDFNLLVVGVPNVGKSTFINALRKSQMLKKGKATTVGAKAGVTRSVLNKIKVDVNPTVYIIDTPGIMPPKVSNLEVGMRLASCSCVPDHLVGEVNIADYILFWLNKRKLFSYVDYFQLQDSSDNIMDVLSKIAISNKMITRTKSVVSNEYVYRPDVLSSAVKFISAFRSGSLGHFVLDDDSF